MSSTKRKTTFVSSNKDTVLARHILTFRILIMYLIKEYWKHSLKMLMVISIFSSDFVTMARTAQVPILSNVKMFFASQHMMVRNGVLREEKHMAKTGTKLALSLVLNLILQRRNFRLQSTIKNMVQLLRYLTSMKCFHTWKYLYKLTLEGR